MWNGCARFLAGRLPGTNACLVVIVIAFRAPETLFPPMSRHHRRRCGWMECRRSAKSDSGDNEANDAACSACSNKRKMSHGIATDDPGVVPLPTECAVRRSGAGQVSNDTARNRQGSQCHEAEIQHHRCAAGNRCTCRVPAEPRAVHKKWAERGQEAVGRRTGSTGTWSSKSRRHSWCGTASSPMWVELLGTTERKRI